MTVTKAKGTKTERLFHERFIRNLRAYEDEGTLEFEMRDKIPEAWVTLEYDVDVTERKVKISLRLDESVAKYYRAMGIGYQARINRILATYAQMRIAKINDLEAYMRKHKPVDVAY